MEEEEEAPAAVSSPSAEERREAEGVALEGEGVDPGVEGCSEARCVTSTVQPAERDCTQRRTIAGCSARGAFSTTTCSV